MRAERVDILRIAPPDDTKAKGRSFEAGLLGYIRDADYGDSNRDRIRPVFLQYATSVGASRPFTANLQCGREANLTESRHHPGKVDFEVLRSAKYVWSDQRIAPDTVVTSAFHPDVFEVSPAMVTPGTIEFIAAPATEWFDESPNLDEPETVRFLRDRLPQLGRVKDEDLLRVVRYAPLFARYLDARTGAPIVPDPLFSALLLAASIDRKIAGFAANVADRYDRSTGWGVAESSERFGFYFPFTPMERPLKLRAKPETFEATLGLAVTLYYSRSVRASR